MTWYRRVRPHPPALFRWKKGKDECETGREQRRIVGTVQTVSIATEARTRFLRYAMSVVTGRALPDVRDGLKPVQRRILYTMYQDSNLTFDRKAAKCAQIVGDVMGRY